MSAYEQLKQELRGSPRKWLVTGVAGFIGSNLLEALLKLDQEVTGLDDLSTGKSANLEMVRQTVAPAQWVRFRFIQGSIAGLSGLSSGLRRSGLCVTSGRVRLGSAFG